jgi:hypothetical protein
LTPSLRQGPCEKATPPWQRPRVARSLGQGPGDTSPVARPLRQGPREKNPVARFPRHVSRNTVARSLWRCPSDRVPWSGVTTSLRRLSRHAVPLTRFPRQPSRKGPCDEVTRSLWQGPCDTGPAARSFDEGSLRRRRRDDAAVTKSRDKFLVSL